MSYCAFGIKNCVCQLKKKKQKKHPYTNVEFGTWNEPKRIEWTKSFSYPTYQNPCAFFMIINSGQMKCSPSMFAPFLNVNDISVIAHHFECFNFIQFGGQVNWWLFFVIQNICTDATVKWYKCPFVEENSFKINRIAVHTLIAKSLMHHTHHFRRINATVYFQRDLVHPYLFNFRKIKKHLSFIHL